MNGARSLGTERWPALLAAIALLAGACGNAGDEPTSSIEPTTTAPAATSHEPTTTTVSAPAGFERAPWPTDGWHESSPEEQGMDSARLADMVERLPDSGIDSVTVIRNGYLVLDAVVYPFPEDTTHIVHSCTKSVVATLVGMAVDGGILGGIDVPVVEILADIAPDDLDDNKAAMTVEDLLTMSTGMQCRDSYLYEWQGLIEMTASDNWTAHVLALPMIQPPGTAFEYCNGSSFLLSAILSATTGKSASEYAAEALFGPLGITDFEWPADPDGVTIGWGELLLHPVDMAKIGYLYLRDGEWENQQLVPASWVEDATRAQIDAGTLAAAYGYQWWISDAGYAMALGFGGQYIIVDPDHDLVVAFTSGLRGQSTSRPEQLTMLNVIPAVVADSPLAPNPEAELRLATAIEAARGGPEPATRPMPDLATSIDGVRYEFRENEAGSEWFELGFGDESATFLTKGRDGVTTLEVGLNDRYVVDSLQPVALRGSWLQGDRFRIEYQVIGQVERGTIDFIFEDDIATVSTLDVMSPSTVTIIADRVGNTR